MNVVVDVECLADKPNAVLAAIGVVKFDIASVGVDDTFYECVDIQSCLDHNLVVDASTIRWWMIQPESDRRIFDENGSALPEALRRLNEFVDQADTVWAMDAISTIPVLYNAYSASKLKPSWRPYNVRDFRTIAAAFPEVRKVLQTGSCESVRNSRLAQAAAIARAIQRFNAESVCKKV